MPRMVSTYIHAAEFMSTSKYRNAVLLYLVSSVDFASPTHGTT